MVAKIDVDTIDGARDDLPATWVSSRLRPDFLQTTKAQDRLRALRDKFASFLNALHHDNGPLLVEAWVSQFPTSDLQDSALRLLEHVTYVEPSDIAAGVKGLIAQNPELGAAVWVPFLKKDESGKSADQLTVDLRDLKVRNEKISALSGEAVRDAKHIVFFDDSLNSGTQAVTLLRSWMGLARVPHESESDRDNRPLPTDVQAALREVRVSFVFYARHPTGRDRLVGALDELEIGVEPRSIHGVIDASDPAYTLEGLQCEAPASKVELLEFLTQEGEKLLRPRIKNKGWKAEQPRDFALGFGGLRMTIIFRHSISTGTPAALWAMAQSQDYYWLPLFPRDRQALLNVIRPASAPTPLSQLPEYESD